MSTASSSTNSTASARSAAAAGVPIERSRSRVPRKDLALAARSRRYRRRCRPEALARRLCQTSRVRPAADRVVAGFADHGTEAALCPAV